MRLASDVVALCLDMVGAVVGLGKLATLRTLRGATRAAGRASDASVMPLRRRTRCSPRPSHSTPPRSDRRSLQQWRLNTGVELRLDRGSDIETLAPLLRRRAELLDGLAAELTPRPFGPRHFDGLGTAGDCEEAGHEQLGLFEAILLDRALASEPPLQALVLPNELKLLLACEARERRRRFARAGVAATALVTALTLTISVVADAPARLAIGVAIAVLALGSGLSLLAFLRNSETSWPLEPLIVGLLCETGLGAFLIVEGTRNKALVGDEVATLIGIATVGIPLILKAVVGRLQKL
jgi:hypothetical protein